MLRLQDARVTRLKHVLWNGGCETHVAYVSKAQSTCDGVSFDVECCAVFDRRMNEEAVRAELARRRASLHDRA